MNKQFDRFSSLRDTFKIFDNIFNSIVITANGKRAIALFLFCVTYSFHYAQKAEVVKTGVITINIRVESHQTYDEAVENAIHSGQIKAIEETFGRVVSQNNSMYIENTQTGELVSSNTSFNSISGSYVKAEWVKDDSGYPKVVKEVYNDEIWITVQVSGSIRELTELPYNFESFSLNCLELKCKATEFKDGSDFYQYFKSPENGFLAMYLDDPQLEETFMIAPAGDGTIGYVGIEADKGYVFFKKDLVSNDSKLSQQPTIEEKYQETYFKKHSLHLHEQTSGQWILTLDNNRYLDQYIVYILFSQRPFKKPILSDKTTQLQMELNINDEEKDDYIFPKSLKSANFQDWLQKLRMVNENLQLYKYTITLSK